MPIPPRARRACAWLGAACLVGSGLVPAAPAHAAGTAAPPFAGLTCFPRAAKAEGFMETPPDRTWWGQRLHYDQLSRGDLTGAGVTIAVIDTGVDVAGNAFLSSKNVVAVEDMIPEERRLREDKADGVDCDHGTAVAALIVGDRRVREGEAGPNKVQGTDLRGIAPGAKVVALRALTTSGAQQKQDFVPVVAAIRRAIELKVKVISISQSSSTDRSEALANAVADAIGAGIVVVAAAGNDGAAQLPPIPASYPGVIAVGMTDVGDRVPVQSSHHADLHVTVAAPGVDMALVAPGQWPAQAQAYRPAQNGTSYAAPLVAGTVALMLQKEPNLTPAQVRDRLVATADPGPGAALDPQVGAGIVNPWRAVTSRQSAAGATATPTPEPAQRVEVPKPVVDHRPRTIALAVAGGAVVLAALGWLAATAIPAAARRGHRPADR